MNLNDMRTRMGVISENHWKDVKEACRGKTVVLVEGEDDKQVLEALFALRRSRWEVGVAIVAAGNRHEVLKRLAEPTTFRHTLGFIDRDVWTDEEVARTRARFPDRLFVTAGWCLESHYLNGSQSALLPADVWAQLQDEREAWIRAGALYWTLQRRFDACAKLRDIVGWDYGKPHPDLDPADEVNLAAQLQRKLSEREPHWEAQVDFTSASLAAACAERYQTVAAWSTERQWLQGLHGKYFFEGQVGPALERHHHRQGNWRVELVKEWQRPYPEPFDEFLAVLFP